MSLLFVICVWALCLITKGDSIEACAIPKHDRGAITLPCAAASAPRSSGNRGFYCLLAFVRLLRPPIGVLSRQQSRCCTRARESQGKSVGKGFSLVREGQAQIAPSFSPSRFQSQGIRNDWADAFGTDSMRWRSIKDLGVNAWGRTNETVKRLGKSTDALSPT